MDIQLFTTMPQSVEYEGSAFMEELKKIAVQSEKNGYRGTLIYSDNRLADPWMITSVILAETRKLLPMIALQPVYMHPYTVAKKIASIGLMYRRKIALNLIAGGFRNDLLALGDSTEHDKRYDRLCEYTEIIQRLLISGKPVSYDGEFYQVKNLKMQPQLPESLQPEYYLSGSSPAAEASAKRLGATLIQYPEPKDTYPAKPGLENNSLEGIRIGVLARDTHQEAWREAAKRFPETRQGVLSHHLAEKVSDSEWHKKLSEQDSKDTADEPVYWLGPFRHYQTFCPYLVGDHQEVAEELSYYLDLGCRICILDIPVSERELRHTMDVFKLASLKTQEVL